MSRGKRRRERDEANKRITVEAGGLRVVHNAKNTIKNVQLYHCVSAGCNGRMPKGGKCPRCGWKHGTVRTVQLKHPRPEPTFAEKFQALVKSGEEEK